MQRRVAWVSGERGKAKASQDGSGAWPSSHPALSRPLFVSARVSLHGLRKAWTPALSRPRQGS
ncbi:rCG23413 [Rattus norvegicus]|uniref:RCG23413 n=1 Tax=Rattus norvegicus TaxID=10116 RepID=A6KHE7_RAT|nr:rCG23413 [Rattus norvegicus]